MFYFPYVFPTLKFSPTMVALKVHIQPQVICLLKILQCSSPIMLFSIFSVLFSPLSEIQPTTSNCLNIYLH